MRTLEHGVVGTTACACLGGAPPFHCQLPATMRATRVLCRNSKGYSWYNHFKAHGQEGFRKNPPPTPFSWDAAVQRPRAFFELSAGGDSLGTVVFELASDIVPKTVENFKKLCTGDTASGKSYKGTKFHIVNKGKFMMGGDVEAGDGSGNHSAGTSRYIKDENFIIPHSSRGVISMASVGLDTGGSQFYITMGESPQLNGRCVAFGRVVEGDSVFSNIEKIFTFRNVPSSEVVITDCGVV